MFILRKDTFLLQENVKQAKLFLKKFKGYEKEEVIKIFNNIINSLNKMPNLVDTFTKMLFKVNNNELIIPNEHEIQEFNRISNWLKNNKNIIGDLSKNINQYNELEELNDDIEKLETKKKVEKFKKSLYRSMRDSINRLPDYEKDRFNHLALEFMNLPEEQKKLFTPLKYFEKNNVSIKEFLVSLEKFVGGQDVNEEKKKILQYVKDNNIKVLYNKNNVLVISTKNKEHVCELGSQRWCIVYSDSYYSSYIGNKQYNTQIFIYNFNLPTSNPNSLFGLTLLPNGQTMGGGSQNKINNHVRLSDIIKMTGIPEGIIESDYKKEYEEINKEIIKIKKLISKGEYIESIKIFIYHNSLRNSHKRHILSDEYNKTSYMIDLINKFNNIEDLIMVLLKIINSDIDSGKVLDIIDTNLFSMKTNEKKYSFEQIKNMFKKEDLETLLRTKYISELVISIINQENILEVVDWATIDTNLSKSIEMNSNAQYSLQEMLHKKGWEYLINFLENCSESIVSYFSSIDSLFSIVMGEEHLSFLLNSNKYNLKYYLAIDIENAKKTLGKIVISDILTIDNYKKLMNINFLKDNMLFIDFLSYYIVQEDKFELIKQGYRKLINTKYLINTEKIINYLSSLSQENQKKFLLSFEIKNTIFLEYLKNFFKDYMIKYVMSEDFDTFINNFFDNAVLFNTYSYSFNLLNFIENYVEKFNSYYKHYYTKLVDDIITNCKKIKTNKGGYNISNIGFRTISDASIKYKMEEIIDVYEKHEDIINEIFEKISEKLDIKLYENLKSDDQLKKYVYERYNPYEDIKNKLEETEYKTFNDYYKNYLKVKKILDEDYMDSDRVERTISYWTDLSDDRWIGKKDTLFKEYGLTDLFKDFDEDFIIDLIVEPSDYYNITIDYLKFLGEQLLEKGSEEKGGLISYAKYLANNEYMSEFHEEIGLNNDMSFITTYDELWELYNNPDGYSNFLDWEALDSGFEYYDTEMPNGIEDWLDLHSIYIISRYFSENGLSIIDMSVFDKYKEYIKESEYNKKYSYYKVDWTDTQSFIRKDEDLKEILSIIEEVIGEKLDVDDYEDLTIEEYEDFLDEVDIDELNNILSYAYNDAYNSAYKNDIRKSIMSELSEVLYEWEDGEFIKYQNGNFLVKPNIDVLFNDDIIQELYNYTNVSDFDVSNLFEIYPEVNDGLSIPNFDYLYADVDYDDYNNMLHDRLSDITSTNVTIIKENIEIMKFEKFKINDRFISEFNGDKERAEEELKWYKGSIDHLQKNGGEIYRLIFLENLENLDDDNLGEHWTIEFSQLSNFYESLKTEGLPYLITGYLKPGQIDEYSSITTFMDLPHELEINLKSQPKKYKIEPYKDTVDAIHRWENS
jgi:hypothetical protein